MTYKQLMNKIKYIVYILFLSLFFYICYLHFLTFNRANVIKIKPGTGAYAVVKHIHDESYISPVGQFVLKAILNFGIKAGNYSFKTGDDIFKFAAKVRNGESEECSFTFVPGKTFYQYKELLKASEDFSGDIMVDIEDGYILPDTYIHKCQTSKDVVVKTAVEAMHSYIKERAAYVDFENFYLKTAREILIMASIVEKESSASDERPIVASVFRNRLKTGMKLQTDPTVIYQESNKTGDLGRPLTRDDLQKDGIYNTYKIPALPFGPIASPSKESIEAVLKPANTNYFYFVSNGSGIHNFSQTYDEHLKNVNSYREKSVPRGTI